MSSIGHNSEGRGNGQHPDGQHTRAVESTLRLDSILDRKTVSLGKIRISAESGVVDAIDPELVKAYNRWLVTEVRAGNGLAGYLVDLPPMEIMPFLVNMLGYKVVNTICPGLAVVDAKGVRKPWQDAFNKPREVENPVTHRRSVISAKSFITSVINKYDGGDTFTDAELSDLHSIFLSMLAELRSRMNGSTGEARKRLFDFQNETNQLIGQGYELQVVTDGDCFGQYALSWKKEPKDIVVSAAPTLDMLPGGANDPNNKLILRLLAIIGHIVGNPVTRTKMTNEAQRRIDAMRLPEIKSESR